MGTKKTPALFPALLLCVISALSGQETKAPKLEDFAGTLALTGAPGGLLALELPEAVYQGLERPDRGDIRVFDETGRTLPFVIRRAPGSTINPPPEAVPFFRWEQENGAVLPGGTDITINAEGTVLSIKSGGLPSSAPPAWLLDLSGLSYTPATLHITLGGGKETCTTPGSGSIPAQTLPGGGNLKNARPWPGSAAIWRAANPWNFPRETTGISSSNSTSPASRPGPSARFLNRWKFPP